MTPKNSNLDPLDTFTCAMQKTFNKIAQKKYSDKGYTLWSNPDHMGQTFTPPKPRAGCSKGWPPQRRQK